MNLPTRWNGRVMQMGGGGYNGRVVTGLDGVNSQLASMPTPLALGYVTAGSDSGHEAGSGFDASFALNDEALANFGHLQVKKTHDVAMYLVMARYGQPVRHSYFAGGWQCGHEALIAAQKYPADFDGVIAQYSVDLPPSVYSDYRHVSGEAEDRLLRRLHGQTGARGSHGQLYKDHIITHTWPRPLCAHIAPRPAASL